MQMKTWALTMGVGAVAGAVAVMMLPRQNPARKLASQTAQKVEKAAGDVTDKLSQQMGM